MERTRGVVPTAVLAAVLVGATFGAGVLGIAITDRTEATASWWPAAGVGVLTLLLLPRGWWRWLIPALALAYVGANWVQGRPLDAAIYLGLADSVETVVVSLVVHDRMGRRMTTIADFTWFLGASLGGAMLAALGVATTSALRLNGHFEKTLAATTTAHWASVMLIAPLGLIPYRRLRGSPLAIGSQVVLLLGATLLAFSPDHQLTLGFFPLPFLIWAGVAFGYQVVAIEQVVLSVMVSTLTLMDRGPFAAPAESGNQVAQLYLVSLVIAGLPLALAVGEQREATATARAASLRTEKIIESSPVAILVTDAHGILLSMNPALTVMTGFEPHDLLGRPFWERLIPPDRWHNAQAQIAGLAPQGGSGAILTASGGERIVTYSNGFLIDPEDGSVNYVITASDITAERASSHFLQHLLSSATTVAILGTDHDGALTLVNAGAERMLRITRDQAVGRSFADFLDPEELAERSGEDLEHGAGFDALVHELDTESVPHTRDWTWLPPDGVPLRVSMTSSLVSDAQQRPVGFLFVARDVTETRRNQELLHLALEREQAAVGHLRALDHAKDDFVSTVSHELRTPLASIIGSIELLSDGSVGPLEPDQHHLLDVIDRNAGRLLALANDLLLLATFESTSARATYEPVDLRDVVAASNQSIAALLLHRDLHVAVDVPERPVYVLGDAGYLERAVTNLLTNAIKFTPDGGRIVTAMDVDADRNRALLAVADSGIGIPADELADVFQRFFRSSNVRADAIQGTGLGLSIVRSIVESHRGSIEVTSNSGEGTTFTIALPLASAPVDG